MRHDYCRIKDNKRGFATSSCYLQHHLSPYDPILPPSTSSDAVAMLVLLTKISEDRGMMPQDALDVSSSLVSSYD